MAKASFETFMVFFYKKNPREAQSLSFSPYFYYIIDKLSDSAGGSIPRTLHVFTVAAE